MKKAKPEDSPVDTPDEKLKKLIPIRRRYFEEKISIDTNTDDPRQIEIQLYSGEPDRFYKEKIDISKHKEGGTRKFNLTHKRFNRGRHTYAVNLDKSHIGDDGVSLASVPFRLGTTSWVCYLMSLKLEKTSHCKPSPSSEYVVIVLDGENNCP